MGFKVVVKYNGNVIATDNLTSSTVNVRYNNNILKSFTTTGTTTLQCKNLVMRSNVTIGTINLDCANLIMRDNVIIEVTYVAEIKYGKLNPVTYQSHNWSTYTIPDNIVPLALKITYNWPVQSSGDHKGFYIYTGSKTNSIVEITSWVSDYGQDSGNGTIYLDLETQFNQIVDPTNPSLSTIPHSYVIANSWKKADVNNTQNSRAYNVTVAVSRWYEV